MKTHNKLHVVATVENKAIADDLILVIYPLARGVANTRVIRPQEVPANVPTKLSALKVPKGAAIIFKMRPRELAQFIGTMWSVVDIINLK